MVVVALAAVVSRAEDRDSRRYLRRLPRTPSRAKSSQDNAELGGSILRARACRSTPVSRLTLRVVVRLRGERSPDGLVQWVGQRRERCHGTPQQLGGPWGIWGTWGTAYKEDGRLLVRGQQDSIPSPFP